MSSGLGYYKAVLQLVDRYLVKQESEKMERGSESCEVKSKGVWGEEKWKGGEGRRKEKK